jgi:hypothetical protein
VALVLEDAIAADRVAGGGVVGAELGHLEMEVLAVGAADVALDAEDPASPDAEALAHAGAAPHGVSDHVGVLGPLTVGVLDPDVVVVAGIQTWPGSRRSCPR